MIESAKYIGKNWFNTELKKYSPVNERTCSSSWSEDPKSSYRHIGFMMVSI